MAAAGRNTELSEPEKNSLLGYLVRQHREAEATKAQAKAKDDETMKKAKEWGFTKEEVTFFEKARKAGDGSTLVQKHSLHKKILIKLGLIPDEAGGDLFADRADRLQLLRAKGHSAGLVGDDCVSNYPGGSDEDRSFVDGWKAGQAEFADNWQAAMEKKNAALNKEAPEAPRGNPFAKDKAEAEAVH
jgi:hypothetical protein